MHPFHSGLKIICVCTKYQRCSEAQTCICPAVCLLISSRVTVHPWLITYLRCTLLNHGMKINTEVFFFSFFALVHLAAILMTQEKKPECRDLAWMLNSCKSGFYLFIFSTTPEFWLTLIETHWSCGVFSDYVTLLYADPTSLNAVCFVGGMTE